MYLHLAVTHLCDLLVIGDNFPVFNFVAFHFPPPERSVFVNEQEPITVTSNGETVFLTGLQFNGSLNIFGLDVTLTVNPISDGNSVAMEDVACAVVFVGRNSQSVVASNPVRWDFCGIV